MTIYLIVFGAMLLIIGAMAIGVILGRKPNAGSCGGGEMVGVAVSHCASVTSSVTSGAHVMPASPYTP